ncbi:DUF2142 domain-containing protein [Agromyces seonyuensis]|uniref:Uncharacterized protein n=1 Tax=Agromyces seonyuensis TaxID=2662446 RepID=A0A6I4NZY2_9MICO|nr:DUF2142 domain-containing protein [Agromyces seonyuensis]MWB99860.1 hypothetical protein [Agromyces seonyuensis]
MTADSPSDRPVESDAPAEPPTIANRWYSVALIAAIGFAVTASALTALTNAYLQTPDETAHLDYAVQVWHGALPVFENGPAIAPPFGAIPPVQWVAQHPPLFYALLAPVVGPLVDAGRYPDAVLAGRLMNSLLSGVAVLAVWWAARRLHPTRPAVAPVAAIAAAMTGMLLLVGGAIYSDQLVIVFAALAVGVAASVLRNGVTTRLMVAAVLVATGGMLSRLAFALFLVALVAAVILAPAVAGSRWRGWARKLLALALMAAVTAVSSGWFYLRNQRLTGHIAGGHSDWSAEHLGRVSRSLSDVATDMAFWTKLLGVYRFNAPIDSPLQWALLVPAVVGVGVVVVLFVRRLRQRRWGADLLIVPMCAALVLGLLASQVQYTAFGGGVNTRYVLPLTVITATLVALGLTNWRRAAVALVAVWTAVAFWQFASSTSLDRFVLDAGNLMVGHALWALAAVCALGFVAAFALGHRRRAAPTATPAEPQPPAATAAAAPTEQLGASDAAASEPRPASAAAE